MICCWRLRLEVWLVLLCTCTCRLLMAAEEMITREVCHLETFEASCPKLHVILVEQALYGSMELNRCITTAFGYEGCQADVLPLLDRECSGRERCSFSVTKLHGRQYGGANICPAELTSYLFVRYTCREVLGCDTLTCQSSGLLAPQSSDMGTLGSEVTLTTGCGSPSCPWLLEAQPGQLFNLTLIDLWPRNQAFVDVTDVPGPYCHRYASISEDGYTAKDVTSCGADYRRQTNVYHSHTNRLSISVYEPRTDGASMRFLITYRVIRCPDMEGPADAVVTRHGDQMKVKCTNSAKSWTLVCQGTAWVGEIGICDSAQTGAVDRAGRSSPFGMLIVVGLGVALGVLIGMVLLVVVFVLMKKRRRREFLSRQNTLLSDFSPSRDHTNNKLGDRGSTLAPGGVVRYIPDHSFTATIQLKRQQPDLEEEHPEFTLLTTDCLDDDLGKPCKVSTCPTRCLDKNCLYETTPGNIISAGYPVWQQTGNPADKPKLDIFAKDSCHNVPDARN